MDSLLPEDCVITTFNFESLSSYSDLNCAIKALQKHMKLCTKGSLQYLLDISFLLKNPNVKLRRRYADLLKEVGFSKSYCCFLIRLLNLSRTYPRLRRVSKPISFIKSNMKVIGKNIHNYFDFPCQTSTSMDSSLIDN